MNPQQPQATPLYGWYVVTVLTLAYIVSFIDRQILSLLIEPIRQDLGLSDFEMAWIGPPAFASCFLIFGLFFGHLADRQSRTRLLAPGLTIWCLMTAACAFADSGLEMFLARLGVGLGEAVLTPCALSMISDLFPRDRLGKPIAVYSMGVSLGSSAALIVGSALIVWLEGTGHDPFASLGISATWRETYLLVGLPGLLLLPLLLTMREPARRERLVGDAAVTLADTWRFIGQKRRVYVPLFIGKAVFNVIANAHFWIVPMFERTWGWSRPRAGTLWGVTLLASGLTGVMLGGWLSDRWYRAGRRDGAMLTVWIALIVTLPMHAIAPLMPSGELALLMFVPVLVAIGAGSAAGSTATILVTPNEYRGQMTALSLLIAGGLGQFVGPTSVAALTDFAFGDPKALRYSLSAVVLVFSLIALVVLTWGLRHYRASLGELERAIEADADRNHSRRPP
jgi:MFS family permease